MREKVREKGRERNGERESEREREREKGQRKLEGKKERQQLSEREHTEETKIIDAQSFSNYFEGGTWGCEKI